MAESGLSIGLPELRQEVGYFIGYGRTPGNWSTEQQNDIDRLITSGIRRVYYPPAIKSDLDGAKDIAGYEWSFLRPFTTLSVTSGTADYDLPDDFARFIGSIHYPEGENRRHIVIVPAPDILEYRSGVERTGAPRYAAERWKSSTGSTGQRKECLVWPEPDQAWTLTYQYEAYQGPLTDTYPYPLGGMKMSELYIESCLAVAELRFNDEQNGNHMQEFVRLLIDAVARDKRNGANYFGQMGHREERPELFRRGYTGGTYPITYKGSPV
jgi:hypothetical protein